ncbi:DUF3068 domain-containing protein [Nocardioides sp.]|uniref:DUF3068 domain-containing protein n=1 Tax=Nocardioides sp. TaxID=35761 RepID=UPI00262DAC44|nr:DUF3068 domain-containing protein [Nocardioides sp.]MCW2736531.1 hypothetical protein [Nocardioides sp.]
MQRIIGSVLALLGAFLLTVGVLAQFYAEPRLEKTPIDVDSTTLLSGTVQLSDGSGGLEESPVKAFSVTHADSERSDGDVVVFANSSCLVKDEGDIDTCVSANDPQDRLVSASTDDFATDRVTAMALNEPQYLPPSADEKTGLVNKWPFGAQKETYPVWDGLAGEAVDAEFDRTESIDGLEVYVYRVEQSGTPIELSAGVPGTLDAEKELFIEPMTGSIINQVDHQERLDSDGNPAIVLDLAFTDEQVAKNVEESKSNASSLELVTGTVPIIGYAVGIPALLVGLGLLLLAHRRRSSSPA